MTKKNRIAELGQELSEAPKPKAKGKTDHAESSLKKSSLKEVIKPHGERAGYMSRTISLPPELVAKVEVMITMRKAQKSLKGRTFSAVIAEGLLKVLAEEGMA